MPSVMALEKPARSSSLFATPSLSVGSSVEPPMPTTQSESSTQSLSSATTSRPHPRKMAAASSTALEPAGMVTGRSNSSSRTSASRPTSLADHSDSGPDTSRDGASTPKVPSATDSAVPSSNVASR